MKLFPTQIPAGNPRETTGKGLFQLDGTGRERRAFQCLRVGKGYRNLVWLWERVFQFFPDPSTALISTIH